MLYVLAVMQGMALQDEVEDDSSEKFKMALSPQWIKESDCTMSWALSSATGVQREAQLRRKWSCDTVTPGFTWEFILKDCVRFVALADPAPLLAEVQAPLNLRHHGEHGE
ncbi:hypothetical protein CDV55_105057 [Aspergillus turcosus]|nr:hypothetical protein CDV55_105057 [Aspergillus turcosus]